MILLSIFIVIQKSKDEEKKILLQSIYLSFSLHFFWCKKSIFNCMSIAQVERTWLPYVWPLTVTSCKCVMKFCKETSSVKTIVEPLAA